MQLLASCVHRVSVESFLRCIKVVHDLRIDLQLLSVISGTSSRAYHTSSTTGLATLLNSIGHLWE